MLFFLGIPTAFHQDVVQAVARSLPGEFVTGLPYDGGGRPNSHYLEDCFETLVAYQNGRPKCLDKGLVILALHHFGGGDFSSIGSAFFPFALFKTVDYRARLTATGKQRQRDKNDLVRLLLDESK